MAIRRCPYCKAIIDEADKYCNNCGTQLLFPEDEYEEEEIPGDKIIEEKDEEQEEEGEEEKEEELESGGEEDEEEEEEEEEFEEDLEEKEKEVITTEKSGAEEEEETGEDIERPGEKPHHEFVKSLEEEELRKKYKVALEDDELIFKTKDLEGLTKTVDEGIKEVDRFIGSVRDKGEEEVVEEAGETEGIAGGEETKEDLPPWASGMKEAPSSALADREEAAETGTLTQSREWTTDSGIGVPERVTQSSLQFTDTAAIEEIKEKERRVEPFSLRIKSKLVDLIFITALWLISLWFTAEVIGVSFFRLFTKSPLPVFGFYLILLLLYFFLFLYFLGETLGDHYFSEED
jgi:hypothetical protein